MMLNSLVLTVVLACSAAQAGEGTANSLGWVTVSLLLPHLKLT